MRKQNNYKARTVIFTLLMLVQEISVHAGEAVSPSAEAEETSSAVQKSDAQSDVANKPEVEVKLLDNQAETPEESPEKKTQLITLIF